MENANSAATQAQEKQFFDKYYEGHAYNPLGWRLRLDREVRSLRRVRPQGTLGRVLSLGCGDGQFELLLAPWAKHVLGLDISSQGIEIARRHASLSGVNNVEFRCLPFSELRWDEQFDTIICLAFLHHVPEVELPGLLERCFAHLTTGGLFYSQDPNRNGVLRKVGRLVMGANYHKYHSPEERELDPQELRGLLRAAGFNVVTLQHIDFTLIPALFLLAKRCSWPLYICRLLDCLWCHSPVARWSSGFVAVAEKHPSLNTGHVEILAD